jgi:hypothetical protein
MDRKTHRGVDLPIYKEIVEKYQNLEFLRDDKGRWNQVVAKTGWYQNSDGDLYHYDGVIWDEVPKERIEKLEYLG